MVAKTVVRLKIGQEVSYLASRNVATAGGRAPHSDLEPTTDKQFKPLAPSTQVPKIAKSHRIWPNLGNFQ